MKTEFQDLMQGQEWQPASRRTRAMRASCFRRIVVPIDFSRANEGALAEAVARATPGESIVWLLHTVEPDPALAGMDTVILAKPDAFVVGEAVARLEQIATPARDLGYSIDAIVRHGRRDEVICRIAKELRADLIVLGQHEHVWWERLLARTTTERILRHAPCAVLALPGVGRADDALCAREGRASGEDGEPEPSRERTNNDETQAPLGAYAPRQTRPRADPVHSPGSGGRRGHPGVERGRVDRGVPHLARLSSWALAALLTRRQRD